MTTTMAEPEWDEQTRDLALAYEQVDLCPACGRPSFICQDPEFQFDWVVLPPTRCHAKTALLAAQAQVTEATNPQVQALLWQVTLNQGRG
jgi:hypothetical protein